MHKVKLNYSVICTRESNFIIIFVRYNPISASGHNLYESVQIWLDFFLCRKPRPSGYTE